MHKLTQTLENPSQWFHIVDAVKLFLCSRKICSAQKGAFSSFFSFVFRSQSLPHCIKYTVPGFNFEGFPWNLSYFLSHSVTCFCLRLVELYAHRIIFFISLGDEEFMQKLLLKAIFYSKTFPLLLVLANAIPCFSRQRRSRKKKTISHAQTENICQIIMLFELRNLKVTSKMSQISI